MSSLQTIYTGRIDDDFPAVTRFISFLTGNVLIVSSAETHGNTCWHQSLSLPALRVQNKAQGLSDTAGANAYMWITCMSSLCYKLGKQLREEKKVLYRETYSKPKKHTE